MAPLDSAKLASYPDRMTYNHKKQIMRRPVPDGCEQRFPQLHPVLARVYAARQVSTPEALDYSLARLAPFDTLSGIDAATGLLMEAIRGDKRILVLGDFDADGATSSAVAVRALRSMGAGSVDYLVPNRFEYGYGLTPEIVRVALSGRPDVLVTVDNGISSLAGVALAKRHGLRVIVTDHHLPGDTLPDADALVNPNLPGDGFPSKCLAGVGVIFYVLMALRARLRASGWFEASGAPEPNLARLLDLVALGTLADLVPLDDNNRILVAQGLARIRSGRCQPGMMALLSVSRRDHRRAVAGDLAFAVGPRLNAAGRLTDMSVGIECLLADEPGRALALATRLDELNRKRQSIESTMQSEAMVLLDGTTMTGETAGDGEGDGALPWGLCLYDEKWHPGVIGIVASRIKEHVHRPVIAFADDATDNGADEVRGSARSIAGLHMRDILDAIATRNPGLIVRFGGHTMAAGLTLRRADLPAFRSAFDREVRHHAAPETFQGVLYTDGALDDTTLNLGLAETLRAGGPWGQAFPEPVFDGEFDLVSRRVVGGRHLKLTLAPPWGGPRLDGIAFNRTDDGWPGGAPRAHVAYRLDANEFHGRRNVQLVVEYVNFP
uniref:Single-stranded-DNA-specific exonuclease RecJ n=1 Tax=Candidatus Kentrum eta TaxID=2126337 RepID=A0A450V6Z3_9GAMM|nr:MAG: single-stranded-DNA-specific exonuclease [Candidatus Kentron sp. H]VFK00655.1 MAG: single-stranded-DNA-specific exonuclease [Candidatus Kentron sp. H]VFK04644.1 MAG: single-stranded-DNA-specific exonuclease [Candidatus Kentron sp. H]